MTQKKVYYYDYHTTLDVEPQKTQEIPVNPPQQVATQVPPQYTPQSYDQIRPIQRSNFLPTILILVLVIAIAYLTYSLIPKNYQSCSAFPGSKITSIYPGSCTTFYGKSFIQNLEVAQVDAGDAIPTFTPSPTTTDTAPIVSDPSSPTTKGGLPLVTPTKATATAKTVTPTPKLNPGSNTGTGTVPNDWTKHRYPTQKIALQLPDRFTSTNVTRNTTTNISTFTIYDGNKSVTTVTILPNWSETNNANSQPITFMISDNTGVIKLTDNAQMVYYFEKFGHVYKFNCQIDSNTCDTITKSIEFLP